MNKLMYLSVFMLVLSIIIGCEDQTSIVGAPLTEQTEGEILAKQTTLNQIDEVIPFATTVFVSCANGGVGEDVAITGTGRFIIDEFLDGSTGYHYRYSFTPIESVGVGQVSGDLYHNVGGKERQNLHAGSTGLPVNTNFTANYNLHGPDINFQMKMLVHFTYNGNGDLVADFNSQSVDCH